MTILEWSAVIGVGIAVLALVELTLGVVIGRFLGGAWRGQQ